MTKRAPKWLLILGTIGVSVVIFILVSYILGCYSRGFTGQLVDTNNTPLQGAFVLYVQKTDCFSSGGSVQHAFSAGILETEKEGYFHIPARFHLHIPVFESEPMPLVKVAYSPKTHGFVLGSDFHKNYMDSRMNVQKVILPDRSNDLQMRAWALWTLNEAITFWMLNEQCGQISPLKASTDVKERFVATMLSEYGFLSSNNFSKKTLLDDEAGFRALGSKIKSFEEELMNDNRSKMK